MARWARLYRNVKFFGNFRCKIIVTQNRHHMSTLNYINHLPHHCLMIAATLHTHDVIMSQKLTIDKLIPYENANKTGYNVITNHP